VQQLSQSDGRSLRQFIARLNRLFGELNAFLLVVAIGLAMLDLTCFTVLRVSTELTRAQSAAQTTSAGRLFSGAAIRPGMKMLSAGAAYQ
jgi:hypothetical protein